MREQITTTIDKDLKRKLKIESANRNVGMNIILEESLFLYFNEKYKENVADDNKINNDIHFLNKKFDRKGVFEK